MPEYRKNRKECNNYRGLTLLCYDLKILKKQILTESG